MLVLFREKGELLDESIVYAGVRSMVGRVEVGT
jgi:hypothetical protein